ncbi:hypothetical protein CCMSSC00406_0009431 [Pleurotus cornucopiae]|uniref:Uncharacterized protein n=1 Tax=Pleurotus cornucopiae TaxID=5321 RepID=A0ACB7ITM6_PLECO|nr:hypothetical protein CCMSSC00406_0009431 [Pleurotus cornucopiae]
MPSIITQAPVRNQAFYMDFATFQAEDELFMAPTNYLKANSAAFNQLLDLQLGADPTAGQSDENPIVLDGVSKVDFERFLGVAVAANYQGEPPVALGIPYWLSVLKLANLWGFNDLRRKAIGAISSGELSIMERLSYGRLLKVEKWVAQGYTELVDRREMMTEAEVGQIGWNAMLKICKLREEFYSLKQSASGPQASTVHSPVTSASAVRQAFAVELEEIRAVAHALMVPVAGNSGDSDLGSEPDART